MNKSLAIRSSTWHLNSICGITEGNTCPRSGASGTVSIAGLREKTQVGGMIGVVVVLPAMVILGGRGGIRVRRS
jgi:hypothetical protein